MTKIVDKKYLLAGSSKASAATLRLLSVSADPVVRRRVAENAKTPTHLLAKMALDQDPQVRIAVGLNTATAHATLSRLVYDDHPDVRYWLASTSYLPRRLLIELKTDSNPYVSQRAAHTLALVEAALGSSQHPLTIFQFLEQEHSLLVSRSERLLEHYSSWPRNHILDETIDFFDELKRHFGRQHKLCLDRIAHADGLPGELLAKCAEDDIRINERIDTLMKMRMHPEPNFCAVLKQLFELVLKHIEFAEQELFVELGWQVPKEQIDEMNVRLNQSLLKTAAG